MQADAGHATIATTQHYNHGRRIRATSAADLVAAAITAASGTTTQAADSAAEPATDKGGTP